MGRHWIPTVECNYECHFIEKELNSTNLIMYYVSDSARKSLSIGIYSTYDGPKSAYI